MGAVAPRPLPFSCITCLMVRGTRQSTGFTIDSKITRSSSSLEEENVLVVFSFFFFIVFAPKDGLFLKPLPSYFHDFNYVKCANYVIVSISTAV